VPEHCAGQHCAFDVGAYPDEIVDCVSVVDAQDILFDDRPFVEHLGDVVGGRADQLDTAFPRALIDRGLHQ
jgi:N-formylglutamate amidohydrolase